MYMQSQSSECLLIQTKVGAQFRLHNSSSVVPAVHKSSTWGTLTERGSHRTSFTLGQFSNVFMIILFLRCALLCLCKYYRKHALEKFTYVPQSHNLRFSAVEKGGLWHTLQFHVVHSMSHWLMYPPSSSSLSVAEWRGVPFPSVTQCAGLLSLVHL